MVFEWPCVGRAGELRWLGELLVRDGRAAVIAGLPGVGKTRLAQECARHCEQAGFVSAWATATRAATGIPFGAMAHMLPVHDQRTGKVDDRADLLRRSAAALVERAGDSRLLLVIDDAHLLDGSSATLIHQMAAARSASLLVTVRTGEPTPDPVTALWKDGLAERLELTGLSAEAVSELVTSALGGPVDQATTAYLGVHCQGNALFLRELVLGGMQDGHFVDDAGIWRMVGSLSPSQRLVELVEGRLAGLDEAERALLETVSFGEPLGPGVLEMLSTPVIAERLERRGLLTGDMDRRRLIIRPAHPLYGDVLRAGIPLLRQRSICRSLAEALEATGARRREDTLRIATWHLEGGGARPELMFEAATIARWRYDFALAERLLEASLDSGATFDAKLLAAQLAFLRGRGDEAAAKLTSLAAAATDDRQRSLVVHARVDTAIYQGRVEQGLRVAEEAASLIGDPVYSDEISARRAGLLLGARGPGAGADAAEPLLQRTEGRALVWACHVASYSFGRLGRLQEALDAASTGYAAHLELTQPLEWYPWMHLFFRGEALALAGRLEEAESLALGQYDLAVDENSTEAQAWFAFLLAKMVADRGRLDVAEYYAKTGIALFRALGRPQFVVFCLGYQALGFALQRRFREATETLAALDSLGLPPSLYLGVDLLQARAWTAVAGDNLTNAKRFLHEAVDLGSKIGDRVGEAAALHGLARIGDAREARARLSELAAVVEGDLVKTRAAHVDALVRQDPARLQQVSSLFDSLGAHLLAAEAAAHAAVAWRGAGDQRRAAGAVRESQALAARCPQAATPALLASETQAPLTEAELQAARLAAAGRANKEIAATLNRSVRTIETHLHHVYEKLGISSRTELKKALGRHVPEGDGTER